MYARVHYLLLPRNVNLTLTHPLTVLADPVIWDELRADVDVAISIAQDELRAAAAVGHGMDGVEADVRAGIHARPSLSNLHIHIISQDFRSPALKNAKHYLSFTTPFFIPFDFIPALKLYNSDNGVDVEGVEREVRVREEGLRGELRCVGCGEGFGRGFVRLKRHLEGCSGVMKGGIKRARRPSDD
ncbi:aprataxin-like protein [Saitoella coloradoensis]